MRLKPSATRFSLLLGALFSVAPAWSADLLQVYRDALVNDAQYAAARATAEAGREKLPQGLSGLLPTIGASANTVWNNNTYHPDGGAKFDHSYNSNGYMLTLSQPLFRWQNWVQYDQAKLQVMQSEANFAQASQDLVLRVAQAYFDVLYAQEALKAVRANKEAITQQFEQAKKNAPCIIFIDEIDAVGRHRGAGMGGGHDEREQTLNQLLVEMDGFEMNDGIIVIAATNRPDVLDPALLRPGRFDRQIVVDKPDVRGRLAILKVHTKGKPMADDVDLDIIARRTPGFTGADLSNLVNEAALLAARRDKHKVGMTEMEEAIERVIAGPERKSHVMSDEEKRLTAYHEGGHTLVGMLLDNTDPVHKVTIIPRGRAGGYTLSLPKEDRYYATRSEMLDELKVLLGGRVAEALVLKEISSGASNDLQRATSLARQMICEYGMSPELGPMTFGHRQDQVFLGRDIGRDKDYSEEVAAKIDKEIRKFIDEAYQKTESLLNENMDKLHLIADALIERETLEGEEIDQLMKYGKILSKEENTSEIGTPEPAEVQPAESSAAPSEQ